MGSKKKQKLMASAQEELVAGVEAILSDGGLSPSDRAAAAGRTLSRPGLPVSVSRAALQWLLERRSLPAAGAALATSLETAGLQAVVEREGDMLERVLCAAAEGAEAAAAAECSVSGSFSGGGSGNDAGVDSGAISGGVSSLNLSGFSAESLISPAAAAAGRVLSSSTPADSSDSPDSCVDSNTDSPAAGPLFRLICDRLSSVTDPAESLRAAYLTQLLLPSLRLAASRPEFLETVRGPFEAIALGAEGLSVLTAAVNSKSKKTEIKTANGVKEEKEDSDIPEGSANQLLNALQNLSATEASLGAELLALLAGRLLREKTPLQGITLLAKCIGISTRSPQDASQGDSQKTPQKTPVVTSEDEASLPLPTRLLLLGRLARCIREARLPLTSAAGGQTLLQWLRAAASAVSSATASSGASAELGATGAWYDCAAELMRVSPLVLPLQTCLGSVLVQAIRDCHSRNAETASAASRLVSLTITTYSELHQLTKLVPKLLLSARQLPPPPPSHSSPSEAKHENPKRKKHGREHQQDQSGDSERRRSVVRLSPEHESLLGGRMSRLPQRHVPDLWKTLLYHLREDGLARMERGEEDKDAVSAALELTLQLTACLLSHAAVLDRSTTAAATRALLPDLMTQTAGSLRQMAALVTRSYQSPGHVSGLVSVSLAWSRLHCALTTYCPSYRAAVTSHPAADVTAAGVTSPLAPLGEKRWGKLVKLAAAKEEECARLMSEFESEASRMAPPPCPADPAPCPAQLAALLPSGEENRKLPLAVTALLAERLAALPSIGSSGKRHLQSPPPEMVLALRNAAAAAISGGDALSLTPPPLTKEVLEILEEVGALLESETGKKYLDPEKESSSGTGNEAKSLEKSLELVLALPLEHLPELPSSLLLPLLCLCLPYSLPGSRERSLALAALTALLTSVGCRTPLERLQPGRLLTWLASAPPSLPSSHTLSLQPSLRQKSPQFASPDSRTEDPPAHHSREAGCVVSGARLAVLRCYSGRRAALLGPLAERMVERIQEGGVQPREVDMVIELLRHFVQTNTSLKGSDGTIKQHAKSLSSAIPRLLCSLPSGDVNRSLPALALLIPLRAHKAATPGKPPRWRRLLQELLPGALEDAGRTGREGEEEAEGRSGEERRERQKGESEAAWELLTAVCAAREHLKSELPPDYVMEVWRRARTSDVITADQLRAVLTSAEDPEMELIVSRLVSDTTCPAARSPCLPPGLVSAWLALSGCGGLSAAGRTQQRRGLTALLAQLAGRPSVTPEELSTVTAAVTQKHVHLPDTAYTDALQCCHLCVTPAATVAACEQLRTVCDLLYQLVSGHPAVAATRLPLITQVVQAVAEEVCVRSCQERRPSPQELESLVATANRITRVVREVAALGPLSEPLAPCLTADLLLMIQKAPLDAEVQEAITASIFCLLSQCRDEVITRLRVTLPTAVTHLFHTTVNTYKRFHKFTGRV